MKARAVATGRRLALGTGNTFEAVGHWLSAESHTPDKHSLRADLRWLGVVLRRLVTLLLAAIFYAQLLGRAPQLIYLVPLAWAVMAWQMSDWSATPPPRGVAPESDEAARRRLAKARGALDPNGVMCTYHAPREEVSGS
ncbi:hypothetical protein [Streptomyces sp. NPDC102487]|uniref:hypothetical protein n=1 Tax=Streptomyces sp. NPDC102487 TaxID=3366182 RepID=UPI0037F6015B